MKSKNETLNLIIFGATGSIGRQLVLQALEQGHMVTAFGRNPDRLNVQHENLKFHQGDVLKVESVENAIKGKDVVLCSIGSGRKGIVRSEGTKNIVAAMTKTGVERLICQSTLGAGDSSGNLNFFWKYIMFGAFLKSAFQDHIEQERIVKESKLKWTIVRPAAFLDGKKTGQYLHGFSGSDKRPTLKISRADVADFMLKQLNNLSYLYKTPGLSY